MAIDEQLQSLVYFLTDHLFAATEAGDKIRTATFRQERTEGELTGDDILTELEALRGFITDLTDWEEELVAKINQARQWSKYLRDHDSYFKPIIDLFNSATHPLTDVQAQIRDHHDRHFEGGDHPDWFIKSRCMTSNQSPEGQILSLTTGDNYLVGSHVRLGQLIELLEAFLETLETRFPQLWLPAEEVIIDDHSANHLSDEPV